MTKFTRTVSVDTARHDLLVSLAERAAGPSGEDRVLEGLVFHALHGHEGVWSDNFDDGNDGDVWHREDPEEKGCAFDPPPRYATTYEGAIQALPKGVWISQLHQSGPDGPWFCVLLGADLPKEEATGEGPDVFRAILNAALLVHART